MALFKGCSYEWLNSCEEIEALVSHTITAGGFSCLEMSVVPFSPQGVTGYAVIGESHIAFHSWPEEDLLFVEIVSCGKAEGVTDAIQAIRAAIPQGQLLVLDKRIIDTTGVRPWEVDS